VAATTEVGPILVELSATHGVHLGDVVVGIIAHGAAAALVALVAGALWAASDG
jgi:hypothetical protein